MSFLLACFRFRVQVGGFRVVVRRIKIWKRRGVLKLAVFSYRNLIPSYQSLVTSH